jgi:photosystem II stability/assembly factor-like uncharacterized protein
MKFFAGEWVSDSIVFRVVNKLDSHKDSVKVNFDLTEGDGSLTVQSAYTDKNGLTSTKWKLGSGSCEQKLKASTYDLSGNYLTSTDLVAYGFRTDEWDACSGLIDGSIGGMVMDTINKVTFMIAYGGLYKQGERYFTWEEVLTPVFYPYSPRTINIDKNGIIYISTGNGNLMKSNDHGESWKACTNPYPDAEYYYVSVSNDNSVWVFAWDHKTRYSKDGCNTWTDIENTDIHGFGDYFRLKDGSLLFHGSDCCSLYRSFDEGVTWSKIETPGYSLKLFVDEKDDIFIVTQENGMSIYSSTDYCATFNRVISVNPEWGGAMENTISKYGNFYYIIIPGFGILRSTDLTNPDDYEVYYKNSNLNNLFIDHNGVLIAKDWNYKTVYYRKNSK